MTNEQRGKAIRRARENAKLSPADLARACGVGRVSLYAWQAGRKRPTDSHLKALARACKVKDWRILL